MPSTDVRARILEAAIGLLREQGLAGLSQPRVAKAAGISQSHLTYYFPTRANLLRAVLEAAATAQREGIGGAVMRERSAEGAIAGLAATLAQTENTRVLVSFVLAADSDPDFRALYRELAGGIREKVGLMLDALGIPPRPETVAMVHALGTGLAVIGVALGEDEARELNRTALGEMFRLLAKSPAKPDSEGAS